LAGRGAGRSSSVKHRTHESTPSTVSLFGRVAPAVQPPPNRPPLFGRHCPTRAVPPGSPALPGRAGLEVSPGGAGRVGPVSRATSAGRAVWVGCVVSVCSAATGRVVWVGGAVSVGAPVSVRRAASL